MSDNAGEPARQSGRFIQREVIGPPQCPIMYRWTLISTRWGKLMLHHFLPNADDRAEHDHPSPFITLVLRGSYDDLVPCEDCGGTGGHPYSDGGDRCWTCRGDGMVLGDHMTPGMIRRRAAEHRHRTQVASSGCWTLVLMGPKQRDWGFWKEGHWWPWREHERRFGYGMRCPEPPQE